MTFAFFSKFSRVMRKPKVSDFLAQPDSRTVVSSLPDALFICRTTHPLPFL